MNVVEGTRKEELKKKKKILEKVIKYPKLCHRYMSKSSLEEHLITLMDSDGRSFEVKEDTWQ